MSSLLRRLATVLLSMASLQAAANPSFTVGWSVYVGWNPYQYMARSGLLKKWADKYNVTI